MFDSEEEWAEALQQQREMEERSLSDGAYRFRKKLSEAREGGQQASVGGAKRLLGRGLDAVQAGVEAYLKESKEKPGAKHCSVKWITAVGADVAAFITLKVILDRIETSRPFSTVAKQITDTLIDELRYRRFKEQQPKLFEYKLNTFRTTSYSHMARSLNASMRIAEIDVSDLKVSPSHRVLIGAKLLDILIQTTQLVEVEAQKKRGTKAPDSMRVVATSETLTWLSQANDAMEMLLPIIYPMVVPPLQWAKNQRGGFRFALRNKFALVRTNNPQTQQQVERTEMPVVYDALNAVQNTAWKINPFILETVNAILETGGGLAGIPMVEPEPEPAKPHDIAENADARKAWRKAAHEVRQNNLARKLKLLEVLRTLGIAKTLKDNEAFFFPHNVDFRGRIYPITNYLSPQGDDLSKGLLTFARGKPMDALAARALAIYGANCLDTTPDGVKMSKLTLDERAQWIENHTQQIRLAAKSPTQYTWWAKADAPLKFLAFCNEWTQWMAHGEQHICSLPIAIDGSCNGLQHFSAMFRDPIGAQAVNVIPQEKPQDIYDIVSEKVKDALQHILATTQDAQQRQLATLWLSSGLVTRKLCKRPTMTFGYGSKQYGFQHQIAHFLQKNDAAEWPRIRAHFQLGGHAVIVEACALMAQLIWNALQDTVVAAGSGMAWMQRAARTILKHNVPVQWVVPSTNFPVRQDYFEMHTRQVDTLLAGRLIRPAIYTATQNVEIHKQANAVAPNIIHSLDAAALMHTVRQAMHEGIESFAVVHDSYGCVPADMALLARCTRQSFVRLYAAQDVVGLLYQQFQEQAGDQEVPAPPALGALEVSCVLASDYFFA